MPVWATRSEEQRDFNAGIRLRGANVHAGQRNERPVHHSSIQDRTFRRFPILKSEEDANEVLRSTLKARPKKSNLQQAREELQPFCTVLPEHWVPIRIRRTLHAFLFSLALDHALHIFQAAFRHDIISGRDTTSTVEKFAKLPFPSGP